MRRVTWNAIPCLKKEKVTPHSNLNVSPLIMMLDCEITVRLENKSNKLFGSLVTLHCHSNSNSSTHCRHPFKRLLSACVNYSPFSQEKGEQINGST